MQDSSISNTTNTTTPHPTTTSPIEPPPINLRIPSKYQSPSSAGSANGNAEWVSPSLEWMARTWSVTHSTLPMWRKAKNVRITYSIIPSTSTSTSGSSGDAKKEGEEGNHREEGIFLDDTVESEPTSRTLLPQPKSIKGIDTPDPVIPAAWNWRGKGWLKIASSHWEVLGWGERDLEGGQREKWVVTWFAPSLFTPAGVDVYSDRKEGPSEGLVRDILGKLEGMGCGEVSEVCKTEMREVRRD